MNYLQKECDELNAVLRANARSQIESRMQYLQHLVSLRERTSWILTGLVIALVITSFFVFLPVGQAPFEFFVLFCSFISLLGSIHFLYLNYLIGTRYRILKLRYEYEAFSDDPDKRYVARQILEENFCADPRMGVAP